MLPSVLAAVQATKAMEKILPAVPFRPDVQEVRMPLIGLLITTIIITTIIITTILIHGLSGRIVVTSAMSWVVARDCCSETGTALETTCS